LLTIYTISILTKEDLLNFKKELFQELKDLLGGSQVSKAEWLKSSEVQKLLKISSGTLQNFRINGTIPFKKIGGTLYYSYDAIQKLLDEQSQ